jgi:hypothetical protein
MDVVKAIWDALTVEGTTLSGLIGFQAWSPESPEEWDNTTGAVIYDVLDRDAHYASGDRLVQVDFRCYGGSERSEDARAVQEAVIERMQDVRGLITAHGRILSAELTGGQAGLEEAESEWPVAICSFEVLVSED